jgi:YhcH/YjgK/YiaL family protein
MIIGRLKDWRERFSGSVWTRAFDALDGVGLDSPQARTLIGSDGMYMRVMSYATRSPDSESAVLEAHRVMADVQLTLQGSERIDWFPLELLTPRDAYDPVKDVQHYHRPGQALASVDVMPGTFVVLFPEDAHMPQLVTAAGDAGVKKVVVKVPLASLASGR